MPMTGDPNVWVAGIKVTRAAPKYDIRILSLGNFLYHGTGELIMRVCWKRRAIPLYRDVRGMTMMKL